MFYRSFPLEDITIRSGGDGRTVEAYAAVFNTPAEIHDRDGHYLEQIDPSAFNKAINDGRPTGKRAHWLPKVMFNHGRDMYGNPAAEHTLPIGVPEDIRADSRGVLTVTRYLDTPLANSVLEAVREGAITAQSFQGRFMRSDNKPPRGGFRADNDGSLTLVTRQEVSLIEYGPTPFPAYQDAAVVGVRTAQDAAAMLAELDPDERERLAHLLRLGTPMGPQETTDTPTGAVETQEPHEHSARRQFAHLRRLARERGII
jgi:HK97 family phage prohead protease